jgi:hypothetical protein
MEVGARVWLRKEDSHWGWVPALVFKKSPVTMRGVELINLTLRDDPTSIQHEEKFEVVLTVDPEQLKTADHDDIKLRNLEEGAQTAEEVASSAVVGGVDDLIGLTHLHEPAILHALRL